MEVLVKGEATPGVLLQDWETVFGGKEKGKIYFLAAQPEWVIDPQGLSVGV